MILVPIVIGFACGAATLWFLRSIWLAVYLGLVAATLLNTALGLLVLGDPGSLILLMIVAGVYSSFGVFAFVVAFFALKLRTQWRTGHGLLDPDK